MLIEAAHDIINYFFGFFAGLFLLRFFMQAFRVSFANEIGRFVVTFTDWLVKPLRKAIPGAGGYDWASFIAAWLTTFSGLALAWLLSGATGLGPSMFTSLLIVSFFQILSTALWLFKGALIGFVVLSWVAPQAPVMYALMSFTRPLLAPISKVIPPIGGFDLSPLFALLALQLADRVLSHLQSWALTMNLG